MARNPFGSIYKHSITLRGKKLVVYDVTKRYTNADGKADKKFKRCYSAPEASTQLANFQNEVEAELRAPQRTVEDHTLGELIADYREKHVKKAVIRDGQKIAGFKSNLAGVRTVLDQLETYFGADKPIRQITNADLTDARDHFASTPTRKGTLPAISTVNEKMMRLRRLFKVAIQKRWLEVSPFNQGDRVIDKSQEKRRLRMMSFDEERRLLAACRDGKRTYLYGRHKDRPKTPYEKFVVRSHLIPLIICAVDTALRVGEIFKLEWWQIDLDKRVIYLTREAASDTKTGEEGILPITSRLHEILTGWRDGRRSSEKVFPKFEYKKAFNSACEEAKIKDLQMRDMRSTGATRMVWAGNPESQVMKVTRHRNLKTFLDHYSNVDIHNAQKIGRNLDEFLQNNAPSSNESTNDEKPDLYLVA